MQDRISIDALPIAKLKFVGKEGLPVWAVTHFLEQTCLNHMKIIIIQKICELKAQGVSDSQISISANSADIFPHNKFLDVNFKNLVPFAEKQNNPKGFWYIVKNFKRPIVLLKSGNSQIPLYDYNDIEAAQIWSFKEQSPPEGIIRGAAGALIDLFYADEREERERQAYQNEQIAQSTKNLAEIARASEIINNPNVPSGVKIYAQQQLYAILNAQAKLNQKFGINQNQIDIEL